ncbi:MAG TPA: rhodanese-like domain-containing protein [Haliangiales bacterium]|nr:rhodanese-like domain-containing protein [Haliangiales bacterium]
MPVKRVKPAEAAALLQEGWKYVDVRSVPEFEAGHPAGAVNVPLLHLQPGGMVPNPEFQGVVEKVFAKDEKLVMGCRSGARSMRAAELLASWGYANVVDMAGGFEGERDLSGHQIPGWRPSGLPVEMEAPGRGWADVKK